MTQTIIPKQVSEVLKPEFIENLSHISDMKATKTLMLFTKLERVVGRAKWNRTESVQHDVEKLSLESIRDKWALGKSIATIPLHI